MRGISPDDPRWVSWLEALAEYRAGRLPAVGGSGDQDHLTLRCLQAMASEVLTVEAETLAEERARIQDEARRDRLLEETRQMTGGRRARAGRG